MAFSKLALTAALAASVLAAPPASVTEAPKTLIPADKLNTPGYPQFGNKAGNHMGQHHYPTKAVGSATKTSNRRDTGEWVNIAADANWDSANINDGVGDGSDSYTLYLGNGSTNQGWPSRSQWVSFENMFNNNKNTMFSSCSWWSDAGANDSGPEVGAIWDGIQQAAQASGVDHRLILAVILQESGGCVRVHTTNYGVNNPGLMQDHDGSATCNYGNGDVLDPCPSATIYQMITDGTQGTPSGDGLANCINESGLGTDADFYRAARIYNSGSISSTGNLQSNIATHCYASDIANRLTGWVSAASKCTCDSNPSSCGVVDY